MFKARGSAIDNTSQGLSFLFLHLPLLLACRALALTIFFPFTRILGALGFCLATGYGSKTEGLDFVFVFVG